MKLLAFLLRASRGTVVLAMLSGVIGGVATVALIAVIHRELGSEAPATRTMALAFAGLCLVSAAARVVAQASLVRLGQGAVTRLGLHVCRRILALPYEQFEARDTSSLLAVLTEDIAIVGGSLVGIPLIGIHLPIVVACFGYLGWLSPTILACSLLFTGVAVAAYLGLTSRAVRRLREARAGQDKLVGHFRAIIEGFRELKLHRRRREALLADGLQPTAEAVRDRTAEGLTTFAVAGGWSQFAFFGFLGLLIFALPDWRPLDRATLAGAVIVVLYLMTPLDVVLTWLPALGRARASMLKIEEVLPSLEAPGLDEVANSRAEPLPFRESLRLAGVSYVFTPEPDGLGFALGPLDLTLRRGEVIFLAGGNGSGKTTLVKLLTGLYAPHAGAITLDGRVVGPTDREAYRQLFSVVFADGHLFKELWGLDADGLEGRAGEGLARLSLAGRVRVERGAYSTTDLSQGQRRRLALLTALLEDRPIGVFDEWAANQDPHFKKVFYHEILPELKALGKTLVVVSHDEDYYEVADRVIRLHDGQPAEERPATPSGNGSTTPLGVLA